MNTQSVEAVVAQALGLPLAQVNDDSGPQSLPTWDSVTHLDILLSVEVEFGIKFTADEMITLLSVSAIKAALRDKGVTV
ncbi:MAG: acyl carrier protein [Bryobacterales bacterium]|nr:acyl carrier protein [Bryobacterales bacterium]